MLGESGFERRAHDGYWTEEWVTLALTSRVHMPRNIWEPAAGRGDMANVLRQRGAKVFSSDLVDHGGRDIQIGFDFFGAHEMGDAGAIVTNPPYDCAEAFVRHAIALSSQTGGMVCMLLRNEFDCASGRVDLFDNPPFSRKIVLTKRPRWDWWETDKPKSSPRHNFAWFIWDWRHRGPATIEYGQ